MPSPIVELADLVVAQLIAEGFTDARRAYIPLLDRTNLASRNILVMPNSEETGILTRERTQLDLVIDVGYFKPLSQGDDDTFSHAEIDACMTEVESIKDAIRFARLGAYAWFATVNRPVYSLENRQFASAVSFTFRTSS